MEMTDRVCRHFSLSSPSQAYRYHEEERAHEENCAEFPPLKPMFQLQFNIPVFFQQKTMIF